MMYWKLVPAAGTPVLAAVLLYAWARRPNSFWRRAKDRTRQILFGLIWGGMAALATAWGVDIGGALINVRVGAVMTAGLLFGGPAGILAGFIGGASRLAAGFGLGIGMFTAVPCALSTIAAGFLAALFRRLVFDDAAPPWYYGLLAGMLGELVDMLLIFVMNMGEISQAFLFVRSCAPWMITSNGLCTGFAVLGARIVTRRKRDRSKKLPDLNQRFARWLAVVMTSALALSLLFVWSLQTRVALQSAESLLESNMEGVETQIMGNVDSTMLNVGRYLDDTLNRTTGVHPNDTVARMAAILGISEISVADEDGVVVASTDPAAMGYDMGDRPETAEFLQLLDGVDAVIQDFRPSATDAGQTRKYAGVPRKYGGFIEIGYDEDEYRTAIVRQAIQNTSDLRVGEGGAIYVADLDGNVLRSQTGESGTRLPVPEGVQERALFEIEVDGVSCLCLLERGEDYMFVGTLPASEAFFDRDLTFTVTTIVEGTLFTMLFLLVYLLNKRLVVRNLQSVARSLSEIADGALGVRVDVRGSAEFASLSEDINTTVDALRRLHEESEARLRQELELARSIQLSTLPNLFPPYPSRLEFDIYALIRTAKEVGGDFYDFYLVGDSRLVVLMADVSGKGIPAALFMMRAKTLLKNLTLSGLPVDEVMEAANSQLCAGNDQAMFVTAWLGILDLETGSLEFANAGHNPPMLYSPSTGFRELKTRAGLVLGGMEGLRYRKESILMLPGDRLFLYTDGVTEAIDREEEMYGTERLRERLDQSAGDALKEMCDAVLASVDRFAGSEPQFDDMTMLALEAREQTGMREMELSPQAGSAETVAGFAEGILEEAGVPPKAASQAMVALDEIVSNILRYSGATSLSVGVSAGDGHITMRFVDNGRPYDPTGRPEPDTTLDAEEREPGGLGILLVRRLMDMVRYQHSAGRNMLLVQKRYEEE